MRCTCTQPPGQDSKERVLAAIEAVRGRDDRVTLTAVARELGLTRDVFEARPKFKDLVYDARPCYVTVESIREAIERLQRRGDRISALGVAREAGCSRGTIERRADLHALVTRASEAAQLDLLAGIRRAIKALQNSEMPVTLVAVAKALGVTARVIEKRPALFRVVDAARTSHRRR